MDTVAVNAFPLNLTDYSFNAKDLMKFFAGRRSGIFELGNNLKVEKFKDMRIAVRSGWGWLGNNRQYGISFWTDSPVYLDVRADYIDTIYCRVCVSWFIGKEQDTLPVVQIKRDRNQYPLVVGGTGIEEICLAEFTLPPQTTSMEDIEVVDMRGGDLCPLIDFDSMTANIEKELRSIKEEMYTKTQVDKMLSDLRLEMQELKNGG